MSSPPVRVGPFEIRLDSGELLRDGRIVRIQDLPFRLLAALLERPGEVVSRADLAPRLWGADTHVDFEAGLNTAAAKLREAFGDSAESPRFIETVPKRGYRFIGPLEPVAPVLAGPPEIDATAPGAVAPIRDRRNSRPWAVAISVAVVLLVLSAAALRNARQSRAPVTVAVALFSNETGRPENDRLAQALTDSVVAALAAQPRLAVIGNAPALRTSRPFQDLGVIRDTTGAAFIVIGQIQHVGPAFRVLTHLIRASDQTHVRVDATAITETGEPALDEAVARKVAAAVMAAAAPQAAVAVTPVSSR